MKRIGIYPGTFDPIHKGHIAFARETLTQCALDTVVFAPEQSPRGKLNVTPVSRRYQHIQSTVATIPGLSVIRLQSDQFTVASTVEEIKNQFPGSSFTLLIGSDVAAGIAAWPDVEQLLSEWQFAIGLRHNATDETVRDIMRQLEDNCGIPVQYTTITTQHASVSSSQYRGTALENGK